MSYGYFETKVNGDLVLDVIDGRNVPGAGVQTWTKNGYNCQFWFLTPDGYFQSALKTNDGQDLVLAIKGDNKSKGAELHVALKTGSAGQKWTFDGTTLISKLNNLALDVPGSNKSKGTKVQMYDRNNTAAQSWIYYGNAQRLISYEIDGWFNIKSYLNGLVLDIVDDKNIPGTGVQTWPSNGGDNQKWRLTTDGYLESAKKTRDGKDLVFEVCGGETKNGTGVQVWTKNGKNHQKWQWGPNGTLISLATGKVLEIAGAHFGKSARVQISDANGNNGQSWVIPTRLTLGTTFFLRSRMNPDLVLNVTNGSNKAEAALQVSPFNKDSKSQQWFVTGSKDTTIVSALKTSNNQELVIDVAGAGTSNGTAIQLYTKNGTVAQKWTIGCDGVITNRDKVMDVNGGKPIAGSRVNIWERNNCDGQVWIFSLPPVDPPLIATPSVVVPEPSHAATTTTNTQPTVATTPVPSPAPATSSQPITTPEQSCPPAATTNDQPVPTADAVLNSTSASSVAVAESTITNNSSLKSEDLKPKDTTPTSINSTIAVNTETIVATTPTVVSVPALNENQTDQSQESVNNSETSSSTTAIENDANVVEDKPSKDESITTSELVAVEPIVSPTDEIVDILSEPAQAVTVAAATIVSGGENRVDSDGQTQGIDTIEAVALAVNKFETNQTPEVLLDNPVDQVQQGTVGANAIDSSAVTSVDKSYTVSDDLPSGDVVNNTSESVSADIKSTNGTDKDIEIVSEQTQPISTVDTNTNFESDAQSTVVHTITANTVDPSEQALSDTQSNQVPVAETSIDSSIAIDTSTKEPEVTSKDNEVTTSSELPQIETKENSLPIVVEVDDKQVEIEPTSIVTTGIVTDQRDGPNNDVLKPIDIEKPVDSINSCEIKKISDSTSDATVANETANSIAVGPATAVVDESFGQSNTTVSVESKDSIADGSSVDEDTLTTASLSDGWEDVKKKEQPNENNEAKVTKNQDEPVQPNEGNVDSPVVDVQVEPDPSVVVPEPSTAVDAMELPAKEPPVVSPASDDTNLLVKEEPSVVSLAGDDTNLPVKESSVVSPASDHTMKEEPSAVSLTNDDTNLSASKEPTVVSSPVTPVSVPSTQNSKDSITLSSDSNDVKNKATTPQCNTTKENTDKTNTSKQTDEAASDNSSCQAKKNSNYCHYRTIFYVGCSIVAIFLIHRYINHSNGTETKEL